MNNDFRDYSDYLMHYGVPGMKWRNHHYVVDDPRQISGRAPLASHFRQDYNPVESEKRRKNKNMHPRTSSLADYYHSKDDSIENRISKPKLHSSREGSSLRDEYRYGDISRGQGKPKYAKDNSSEPRIRKPKNESPNMPSKTHNIPNGPLLGNGHNSQRHTTAKPNAYVSEEYASNYASNTRDDTGRVRKRRQKYGSWNRG